MIYRAAPDSGMSRFWLDEICEAAVLYHKEAGREGTPITVAAGMTPSAPIHFGIVREAALASFAAEALKRRGYAVRFIYYWDDFDHFCKMPYFASSSAARRAIREQFGRPLSRVQDFYGVYDSYASHIIRDFEAVLRRLRIAPEFNYQSAMYAGGAYTPYIIAALEKRREIWRILYGARECPPVSADSFYPVEIYCPVCEKDSCAAYGYEPAERRLYFRCGNCGHDGTVVVGEDFCGKLIWKVNWALRWHADQVSLEFSGKNQLCAGGSYDAAARIAAEVFGGIPPLNAAYEFIGAPGIQKLSGRLGTRFLAQTVSGAVEAPLIRWLLLKERPEKPLCIDMARNLAGLYREWDAFCAAYGGSAEGNGSVHRRIYTAAAGLEYTNCFVSFEKLTEIAVNSCGSKKLARKEAKKLGGAMNSSALAERLRCAQHYIAQYHPERCFRIRIQPDTAFAETCAPQCRAAMRVFRRGIRRSVSAEVVSSALAAAAGTSAMLPKRELCRALYRLLISEDSGPPLSRVLAAAGIRQAQKLLNI